MTKHLLVRPAHAVLALSIAFAAGYLTARSPSPSPPSMTPSPFEERGPPTKQELGQAGWTLLHVIAANTPETPTAEDQARVQAFLQALGHLYPCPTCAAHFRSFQQQHPISSDSREALSLWLCEAHNEVNVRNGKQPFFCDIGVLDARWKDCGCGGANKTDAGSIGGIADVLPSMSGNSGVPLATRDRRRTQKHKDKRRLLRVSQE